VMVAVAGPGEVADDVTVRVEQAHARHGHLGQVPLTACLPQQVLGPEHRILCVLLAGWQRPDVLVHGMQADGVTARSWRFHMGPGQVRRFQGEARSVAAGAAVVRNA